ncbi:uncharacterized protein LOC120695804 [Panicum virgatum]|uniref:Uncharacterized protein n=1 Tax=Panicum virgatum TaxID=38727 RepID=A0A8T0WIJ9_PANVG|nr:uncharacterized protein LOC120695804 [Panicum virgatum]KAG2644473.1 hypothetical protein PVAP13_2KG203241 [Panicum virgatum]
MAVAAAAAWVPAAAARRSSLSSRRSQFAAPIFIHVQRRAPLLWPSPSPLPQRSRLVVASAQFDFARAVQTAWRVGSDVVEAGSNLVPGSVPRPIARIGVTFAAVVVAVFLLKSIVSTAFFVLAMMGLIYLGFMAMNPKEASGSRMDETGGNPSEDPVEEARRIMEKYK